MQVVIDIPKDIYEDIMIHNREMRESGKSAYYFEGLIKNGTPLDEFLDKVRAEIEQLHYHPKLDFIRNDDVVEMALAIIDKYKESEVNNG